MCFVMAGMVDMVAITSRSLVHNSNEVRRLEKTYADRLDQGELRTVRACGSELNTLALHYKKYTASRRVGIESMTCREIENHFNNIAAAMEHLFECIDDQPAAIHSIFHSYEHGHTSWSLDGCKRSSDVNNVIMQLWHDGNASHWFLPKPQATPRVGSDEAESRSVPENRPEELLHLAKLMRRLAKTYQKLKTQRGYQDLDGDGIFDEKDALVFNLAELLKRKARPVLHVVGIAALIHEWATGDPSPQHLRFMAAYKTWKNRP